MDTNLYFRGNEEAGDSDGLEVLFLDGSPRVQKSIVEIDGQVVCLSVQLVLLTHLRGMSGPLR